MNERIRELAKKVDPELGKETIYCTANDLEKFAELIVRECMTIAKKWEDELERAKMPSESDAVGIVTYRIARQFGVEE